jgi:hypothetical protein
MCHLLPDDVWVIVVEAVEVAEIYILMIVNFQAF